MSKRPCVICGDTKSNWYYGCVTCEACKKFFIRSQKEANRTYMCAYNSSCNITVATRSNCQYCRYMKCLRLGMNINVKFASLPANNIIQNSECAVCSSPSSGIHFGVFSCEACKGFFRRSTATKLYATYTCSGLVDNHTYPCEITPKTRGCRLCRFAKCIKVGMLAECKLFTTCHGFNPT